MIVICLEGCHGCGKTELCAQFKAAGFSILDEAFLDMPEYMIDPQSLLMETTWVCSWFERLLKQANDLKTAGKQAIFIADRSPFSAVFYAKNGQGRLLEPVIRAHIKEIRAAAAIEIYTVYLQVKPELLWGRIQSRLRREPGRKKYHEDKREWMEQTLRFYESFQWDLTATNNHITLEQVRDSLIRNLSTRSPRFTSTLMSPTTMFSAAARAACSPPHVPVADAEMLDSGSDAGSGDEIIVPAGAGAGAGAGSSDDDVFAPLPASASPVSPDAPAAVPVRSPPTTGRAMKRKAPPSPVSPDDVTIMPTAKASAAERLGAVPTMQSLDA